METTNYHSRCPVCQCRDLTEKYVIKGYHIALCRFCRLMFVRERLTQEDLDRYYNKELIELNAPDTCVYTDQDNTDNLKYYYRRLAAMIRQRMPRGAVLDIGCNTGLFLDVMDGFDRYGIERSITHGRVAAEKYGDHIFLGAFEDYQAPEGFLFDCITLQDVFDHMADPVGVLKKCRRLLKANGLIVIKVHDFSCLYAKMTGKNFYAFLPPLHLFYYDRRSLMTALDRAGFDLAASMHIGHVLFLSTVFYRLCWRERKGLFYRFYRALDGTWLGRRKIYKNLHDIITVFGMRRESEEGG